MFTAETIFLLPLTQAPAGGHIFLLTFAEPACLPALASRGLADLHGEGALRELAGPKPAKPHRWLPQSRTRPRSGPPPGLQRNARAHRPPARRLPPDGPASLIARPCHRPAGAPGLRLPPSASPADKNGSRPCPLGSGCRRLRSPVTPPPPRPPTASARGFAPAPVPMGHSILRLALGLLQTALRPVLRAAAGSPPALLRPIAAGPPQSGPARALPSFVPQSVGRPGRASGFIPPARGL